MASFKIKTKNQLTEKRKKIKKRDIGRKGVVPKRKVSVAKLKKNKKILKKIELAKENKQFETTASVNEPTKKITTFPSSENNSQAASSMDVDQENNFIDVKNAHTIFVGNLPLSATRDSLKKLFLKYGEIESTRIRCSALNPSHLPRTVAVQKHDFHPKATSLNGYVKFKDLKSVPEALTVNGMVCEGHTLRVDKVVPDRHEEQHQNSVFVGNLPFIVADDELRKIFEDCGEIVSVRIIRDKEIGVGKGFGYVNFKSADSIELALRLEGVELRKRPIRVKRAVKKFGTKRQSDINSNNDKDKMVHKTKKLKKPKGKKNKVETSDFQGRAVAGKIIKKKKNKKKLRKELQRKRVIEILNK